jgi:HEAT repeat protein/tRNA A-37 threonylcarbamoyl transferase component Bud32
MPQVTHVGPYRLVRLIGQGGMGVVYEGVHVTIGRRAAIKLLRAEAGRHADAAQRFLNEARAVNQVRHPGLVEIFDAGALPDGSLYLVMEYLEGETLKALLRRGRLPERDALVTALQVAEALSAAHAAGIIHRDVKPDNIILVPAPQAGPGVRAKLLDFGIAKLSHEADLTGTGVVLGTPRYMAPEQRRGQASSASDVYALGRVMGQMLTGQVPSHPDQQGPPLPLSRAHVPPSPPACALIEQMTEEDPARRPTMAEVCERLRAVAHLPAPGARRLRKVAAVGFAALLAVGAAGTVALRGPWLDRGKRAASFGVSAGRARDEAAISSLRQRALLTLEGGLRALDPASRRQATLAVGHTRDVGLSPLLLPVLEDAHDEVRAAAAEALGLLGARAALPRLRSLARLDGPKKGDMDITRLAAGLALHGMGDEAGERLLRQALAGAFRLRAALALCERGDEAGCQVLRLSSKAAPQEEQVTLLGRLALSGDGAARQGLFGLLDRVPPLQRLPVAAALARLGEERGLVLLRQAAQAGGQGQVLAARLLASFGEGAGLPLLRQVAMDRERPQAERTLAVEGLGDGGGSAEAELLGGLLGEPQEGLRLAAAAAALEIVGSDPRARAEQGLRWAQAALGDERFEERAAAVTLIGDVPSGEAVALLRGVLRKDRSAEVRRGAVVALSRRREDAAVEAVVTSLDDADPRVREEGLRGLSRLLQRGALPGDRKGGRRDPALVRRLQALLDGGAPRERLWAGGLLLTLGDRSMRERLRRQADPAARLVLVEAVEDPELLDLLLRDPSPEVRLAAALKLGRQGERRAVPVLREGLARGGVRGLAAYGLLRQLDEEAAPPEDLQALLRGGEAEARLSAVLALVYLPGPEAARLLLQTAVHDPRREVRLLAAQVAAGLMDEEGAPVGRQVLRQLMRDPDMAVYSRASLLLSLGPPEPEVPSRPPPREATGPSPAPAPEKEQLQQGAPERQQKRRQEVRDRSQMGLLRIERQRKGRCVVEEVWVEPGTRQVQLLGGKRAVQIRAGETVTLGSCDERR